MLENSDVRENIEGERKGDVVWYGDVEEGLVENLRGKRLCNGGRVGNALEIRQGCYLILEGT
ncbi:hypothetical protein [Bacillus thuringiensis]|uniref:hypothetical protein n=1 Tax=Bacillus thuringiensis TaxID=1428 RepID=UPI0011A64C8A